MSFQNALNKVFHALGSVFSVPTLSALTHARQKLKPAVFTHLNRTLWTGFYQLAEADDEVKRWRGHRLLATDGTFLTLPDTPETRAKYTVQTNQHAGAECVPALCCVLYDLRNVSGLTAPSERAARRSLTHDLVRCQAYPAPDFQQVYGARWGEETFFDRYKNIFAVERFSGTSVAAVEQDVHGVFFLLTLESILTKPAQAALAHQGAARKTKADFSYQRPYSLRYLNC